MCHAVRLRDAANTLPFTPSDFVVIRSIAINTLTDGADPRLYLLFTLNLTSREAVGKLKEASVLAHSVPPLLPYV